MTDSWENSGVTLCDTRRIDARAAPRMTGSASTSASELHGRQLLNVTLSGKTPLAQGQEFMDNDDDYPWK